MALGLALIGMFVSAEATRREFAITLFFQNGLFFPFIIITGIFGATNPYIAPLFIFIAFHPPLFFSTNHLFFRRNNAYTENDVNRKSGKGRLRLERVLNPVLVSTVIAAGIKLLGVDKHLPTFILNVFQMLGGMSLPLLMLILGGSLYVDFQSKGPIYIKEVMKFTLVKNVIFPLAFIGMLVLVRPAYPAALIIFLESAVPPITGIPIQARRHGANSSITNQFILASFVFSVFSIPLLFAVFARYFPTPQR